MLAILNVRERLTSLGCSNCLPALSTWDNSERGWPSAVGEWWRVDRWWRRDGWERAAGLQLIINNDPELWS